LQRPLDLSAMPSPPLAPLAMSAVDWLMLLALSFLWGASFFFVEVAVAEVPPLSLAFMRVVIAAALLALLLTWSGEGFPIARLGTAFAIMGLFNNVVPFSLFAWGQLHIPSGLASILNATTPLFTVLVAHFATQDDKITPPRLAGLIVGFLGVIIMIGPDMLREIGSQAIAQLACLLAAISYAISGVYGRRFRGESPLVVATGQLAASSVILAPAAFLIEQPWSLGAPSPAALAAVVLLAALSTALAYLIFFRILGRAGATNVMLVTFLIPVTAILMGVLILGEELAPRHVAGMAGIAFGLAAIDGRPARSLMRIVRARMRVRADGA
jgi:drug/metabolite transporter (DMT)-like permease